MARAERVHRPRARRRRSVTSGIGLLTRSGLTHSRSRGPEHAETPSFDCSLRMQRRGIAGEQVRSQSGVGPYPRSADEFAGFAFDKQLAAEAVKGILAACHANLAVLDVAMLDSVGMAWVAEPELERKLLPRVAVQVEAESVQALISECIRRRQSRIGVYSHGHDRRARGPIEQIKVVDANARVFSGGRS